MTLLSFPFLCLVCLAAVSSRVRALRLPLLACACIAFYASGGTALLVWALGDTLLCYLLALGISALARRERGAKTLTAVAVLLQSGLILCLHGRIPGASFLGLILLGYVLDVSAGTIPAEGSLPHFALFALFFPQAAQGPLTDYATLAPQLKTPELPGFDECCDAALRILAGLLKKLVLADRLAIVVQTVYAAPESFSAASLWLAVFAYVVQVYADFSGCMDIVLGAARLMGVRLPENFRQPYLADSFAGYWQRWHITMGAWFRTHVFYPLAAFPPVMALQHRQMLRARSTAARQCAAVWLPLTVTWLLTGLWHGAQPHYLLWGLVNGALILTETVTGRLRGKLPKTARILLVFFVQTLVRVLFRSSSLAQAGLVYEGLFRLSGGLPVALCGLDAADGAVAVIGTAVLFACDLCKEKRGDLRLSGPCKAALALCGIAALALFGMYGPGYAPAEFFYGQF